MLPYWWASSGEEIAGKTREQVRHLLTELRTAVEAGASTDELLAQIDGYLTGFAEHPVAVREHLTGTALPGA